MIRTLISVLIFSTLTSAAFAHDPEATYIANEGVLVTNGETKIMFDPLFSEGFGNYLTVPDDMRAKMMAGEAPFDGIDAVFISHAHGDHFAAQEIVDYMTAQTEVRLFAPEQAVTRVIEIIGADSDMLDRVESFALEPGDTAITRTVGDVRAEAVRIPHSGNRPTIENTVFRVTLGDDITVMHMGDANTDIETYRPHQAHWQAVETDMGFPPYWLLASPDILTFVNIREAVGTHVPIKVPDKLQSSGFDYFGEPGETRAIGK